MRLTRYTDHAMRVRRRGGLYLVRVKDVVRVHGAAPITIAPITIARVTIARVAADHDRLPGRVLPLRDGFVTPKRARA
jgi:hypothetical protein